MPKRLIETKVVNRLTQISFSVRMTKAWKKLVADKQVGNTLNLGDENREK